MLKDCIEEIWGLLEIILCQNMLGDHYMYMVLSKVY